MSNIYDSANQIEREIRELPEFKALKEAYEKVQANEEAHKLFKDYRRHDLNASEIETHSKLRQKISWRVHLITALIKRKWFKR